MMRLSFFALSPALVASSLLASAAFAQQPGVAAPEAVAAAPQQSASAVADPRVNQLIIYGDDPCPQGNDDEIIVCARLPEDDRFRIPPALRENPDPAGNQAWTNRAIELSYAGRTGIGSCTPSGPGGMTGCFNQIVQQARAERAGLGESINWNEMIDEARQARMRRIGEAEVEEAAEENQPE